MVKRFYLNGQEQFEASCIIKEKTGFLISDSYILNQIFRRSSLAAETGRNSNEIFEFEGDRIISYYAMKIISDKCGAFNLSGDYTFRIRENKFNDILNALINNDTLAKIIDEWDIAKYLLLGTSDIKNNVVKETKVKADLLESIIGAIAIKSKWNSQILETVVAKALNIEENLKSMIQNDVKVVCFDIDNAITTLKEIAEQGHCTTPKYEFCGPDKLGYDEDGKPRWECTCQVINDKMGMMKIVTSNSKKNAKKAAAYLILCEHLDMQNKYGKNALCLAWNYRNDELNPI